MILMGKVLVTYKIMPSSPSTDLSKMQETIKALDGIGEVKDFKEAPVAFGLMSLTALIAMPDEAGITDKAEEALSKIEDVQSVETVGVTLL